MKAIQLKAQDAPISLIEPNVERDASLGVQWLSGEAGRILLGQMGNTTAEIDEMLPATVENQKELVNEFLERTDRLNWMIEYEGKVVGSAWVDTVDSDDLLAPSVHLMIGDPNMRKKRVGTHTINTILDYLTEQGHDTIYSRHLTSNKGADKLLKSLGFTDIDEPYVSDGLEFQNLKRTSTHNSWCP